MTIKNLLQRSVQSESLNISRSDMQKRGAVRNLFNATVDREELQMQIRQMERDNSRQLKSYKVDSIIGVIDSVREDQGRKFKRVSSCLDSSDDDSDDQPQRTTTTERELPESSSDNSSPASPPTSTSSSSAAPSTSSKKPDHKTTQPRSIPLAKGQTSIKGNACKHDMLLIRSERESPLCLGPRKGR